MMTEDPQRETPARTLFTHERHLLHSNSLAVLAFGAPFYLQLLSPSLAFFSSSVQSR